ncbi:MAG: transglutaminase-like cysteine peptidase [Pseudomonadota bacterium]
MLFRASFLVAAVWWATSAQAQQVASYEPAQRSQGANAYINVLAQARAPIGWMQFCNMSPRECQTTDSNETASLTKVKAKELDRINRLVNSQITPITDADHFGVTEKWSYPDDNKGDCEDYVLLKRQKLIELGWPASSLLITVVRDLKNEGHAVLTAHTTMGDLILDNVHDDIRAWHETGYKFVKRQSQHDVNAWVSLTDQVGTDQAVAAQR